MSHIEGMTHRFCIKTQAVFIQKPVTALFIAGGMSGSNAISTKTNIDSSFNLSAGFTYLYNDISEINA